MIYTAPHYYNRFSCVASECADTCCAGWKIMIDPGSLKTYRQMKGALGNRLHTSINWKEGSFRQRRGRCAFLNDRNLCDLYTKAGPESLCRTCRTYPRHIEEFEGCREVSLCMSCIEAASLILGCREKVSFITKEDGREENYGSFDFFLYTKLMDARALSLEILQNRSLDCDSRISLCLGLAHDLQGRIERDRLFESDKLFERCRRTVLEGNRAERLKKGSEPYCRWEKGRYRFMKNLFKIFDKMEVLNQDWPVYLGEIRQCLYGDGPKAYRKQRQAFLSSRWEGNCPCGKNSLWCILYSPISAEGYIMKTPMGR